MKSMLLKSVLKIAAYFLIISALASLSESVNSARDLQNPDIPMGCSYNSSYNNSSIKFVGTSRIVQAPATISVGSGYYSAHPIAYGSEIGSQTWLKNGRSAVSMQQDITGAHGINGQIDAAAADSSYDIDGSEYSGSTSTQMLVDENVVDGRVHIGVLQGNDDLGQGAGRTTYAGAESSASAWKKPTMEIDEDYIGTYHIYKNITLKTSHNEDKRNDSWLSCCNDGYFNINIFRPDKILDDADDIFNCKAADPWKILKAKDKLS